MVVFCLKCDKNKAFTCRSSLNRHLKTVHNCDIRNITSYDMDAHKSKCFDCSVSFKFISELREHLHTQHEYQMETENKIFNDYEEFEQWLSSLLNDNVQYVRDKGSKVCASNRTVTYYYNCNRSYMRRGNQMLEATKTKGKRSTRRQGSSKLDFNCTSQIKAVREQSKVTVTYYKTHYRHDKEIQHLRISKEDRRAIANKLLSGVSVSEIIDEYRDGINGENLNRIDLLTRKDVHNIKMSRSLLSNENTRNNNVAIDMFFKEEKTSNEDGHDAVSLDMDMQEEQLNNEGNSEFSIVEMVMEKERIRISNEDEHDAISVDMTVEEESIHNEDNYVLYYKKHKPFHEDNSLNEDLKACEPLTKKDKLRDKINAKLTEIRQKILGVNDYSILNECYDYLKRTNLILDTEIIPEPFVETEFGAMSHCNDRTGSFTIKKVDKRKESLFRGSNEAEIKCSGISKNDHDYV